MAHARSSSSFSGRASKTGRAPQKGPSQRQQRVGEEIRHILADLFMRRDFREPDLRNLSVTVTQVKISPDFSRALAFVCLLGGRGTGEAVTLLNASAREIRGALGRRLRLKVTPEVKFAADDSFDAALKLEALLASPAVRRDLEGDPELEKEAE